MRAKPCPPDRRPFSSFKKPKHILEWEQRIIRKRYRLGNGLVDLNGLFKWNYGGDRRTREEEMFFGKAFEVEQLIYECHPLLNLIKKG